MTENDILSLFNEWNSALKTGNPKSVAELYAKDATLLPTLSPQVCRSPRAIEEYFLTFLAKKPRGQIVDANVRIFGNIAINSGVYVFTFDDLDTAQARYTFVYQFNGQRWMIVEHHSSLMPAA